VTTFTDGLDLDVDQSPLDAPLMKRYLLGDVSEKEQLQIEQEFLVNDDVFEEMLMIEEELIDAYVEGDLSTGDQVQFEKHILAQPDRRQRVAFARALKTLVGKVPIEAAPDRARPEQLSWWRWVFASPFAQPSRAGRVWAAASVVIVLGASAWLAKETLRPATASPSQALLRTEIEQLQADRAMLQRRVSELEQQIATQSAQNEQLAADLERQRKALVVQRPDAAAVRPQQPLIASFILLPGLARDAGGVRELSIPDRTETVQLQLDLDADDYSRYRAILRTADDVEILNQDVMRSPGAAVNAVTLRVPAGVLASGDYVVELSGATRGGQLEQIGDYHFRAVKR